MVTISFSLCNYWFTFDYDGEGWCLESIHYDDFGVMVKVKNFNCPYFINAWDIVREITRKGY